MVLTNSDYWTRAGVTDDFEQLGTVTMDNNNMPTMHQSACVATTPPHTAVSHISSNGYYGFSYLNSAHAVSANSGDLHVCAADEDESQLNACKRGKKRCCEDGLPSFVGTVSWAHNMDVDAVANITAGDGAGAGAKRCRYDDQCAAAAYCSNPIEDCLSAPTATGVIATQSCYMDTDDLSGRQQATPETAQVSVQQQAGMQLQSRATPQQQYQGHLHRANRDVARCMLSHMI